MGAPEDRIDGGPKPLTPDELLKQVAMPGWIELHVRQINLRTDSARRFAACAVDTWSEPPEAPRTAPAEPDPSRREMPDLRAVQREVEEAVAAAAAARAATEERRRSPELTGDEMKVLRSMHDTIEGKLAYATTVIAAEIEQSPVWTDQTFIEHHVRIDLFDQVTEIVLSARALLRSKEALGPRPSGALAQDAEVMDIFERRERGHQERLAAITARVQAFLRYRDHVRDCEPELEKRAWIEAHSAHDESEHYVLATTDQRAGVELSRASDEVGSRTRAAIAFLADDATRLSWMSS